jgi:sec-independent protein translocase protein TatA
MFGIDHIPIAFLGGSMSGGEILLIMVALLMLFGSKNLPSIARNIGKSMETFRKASREVTDEIMRADINREPEPKKKQAIAPASTNTDAEKTEPELAVKPSAHTVERDETPGT